MTTNDAGSGRLLSVAPACRCGSDSEVRGGARPEHRWRTLRRSRDPADNSSKFLLGAQAGLRQDQSVGREEELDHCRAWAWIDPVSLPERADNEVLAYYIDRVNQAAGDCKAAWRSWWRQASKPQVRPGGLVRCLKGINVMTDRRPQVARGQRVPPGSGARSFAAWIGLATSGLKPGVTRHGITRPATGTSQGPRQVGLAPLWPPRIQDLPKWVPDPRAGRMRPGVREARRAAGGHAGRGLSKNRRASPARRARAGSGRRPRGRRPDAATRPDGRLNRSHHPSRRFRYEAVRANPRLLFASAALPPAPKTVEATSSPSRSNQVASAETRRADIKLQRRASERLCHWSAGMVDMRKGPDSEIIGVRPSFAS